MATQFNHWHRFQPGDRVRVTHGPFAGRSGQIIGVEEAAKRRLSIGDRIRKGFSYWIIILVCGREVPVALEPSEFTILNHWRRGVVGANPFCADP